MDEPKQVPVFTVRLPVGGSSLEVMTRVEFMLDTRVDRKLLVAILKNVIAMLEGGRSPEEIALARFRQ